MGEVVCSQVEEAATRGSLEVVYSKEEKEAARARLVDFSAKFHNNFSTSDTFDFYNSWATHYDKDLDILGYTGPTLAADHFVKHATQIGLGKEARILDVAAGTGRVAVKLVEHGFFNLEANDLNETMLNIAKEKGVYKQFHVGKYQDIVVPDKSYDAVLMAGYSSLCGLETIPRLIKTGGLFVTALRNAVREREKKYVDAMEAAGVWECLEDLVLPGAYHLDDDALVLVYKIL